MTVPEPVRQAQTQVKETASIIKGIGSIGQGVLRGQESIGRSIPSVGKSPQIKPETKGTKFLFGEGPLIPKQEQVKKSRAALEGFGLSPKVSGPLALGGVAGLTALDVSDVVLPGKSKIAKELGEEGIEKLTKQFGKEAVEKFLKGKGDDVIRSTADDLIKNTVKGVPLTDLRSYEKAINSGDKSLLYKLSRQYPDDVRFQVHKQIPGLVDAEQKVIDFLSGASGLAKSQSKARSEALSQRVAKAESIIGGGEAGFKAQKGALKGALPKADFEPLREGLKQADVDELLDRVDAVEGLKFFERLRAKEGLIKVMEGNLPGDSQLKLLEKVYSKDMLDAIKNTKSTKQKALEGMVEAVNLPRSLMSSTDFSAPFRQGVFFVTRPKQFLPAMKDMFSYAFNPKAYDGLLDDIASRPTYNLMQDSKLALTDVSAEITKREEAFISNWANKIPGIGKIVSASDRAYSGFLTKLRADVFDDIIESAVKSGKNPDVDSKFTKDLAKFINSATGRGEFGDSFGSFGKALDQSMPLLQRTLFSPRLIASRANMLNPAFYIKLDPMVRKEAVKSLMGFLGTGATIATLAKLGGADVELDSRSSDFGKIRIGKTRYDIWGGFQQYMVLISRLLNNQTKSATSGKISDLGEGYKPNTRASVLSGFITNKASPPTSFVLDMLRGKDFKGDDFDLKSATVDRFIPMIVGDLAEIIQEEGIEQSYKLIPGVFGVGTQTFDTPETLVKKPKKGKSSFSTGNSGFPKIKSGF